MRFIENYFIQILEGRRTPGSILRFFSSIYHFCISLRAYLYRKNFLKSCKIEKAKVISVGNLWIGGVGKTPLVVKIVERLEQGKVALLLRGYRGKKKAKKPYALSLADKAWEVGDEPYLLKQKFPSASVWICPKRILAAQEAAREGKTFLIMDDGFQHLALRRDVNILVINGKEDKALLLPAGGLREGKEALTRADYLVFIGEEKPQWVKKYASKLVWLVLTPMAMSADCSSSATMTPHVLPSYPNDSRS